LALGWDFVRAEVGGYVAMGGLTLLVVGLGLAYLWTHREL
jgi:hypothetical protein